MKYSAPAAASIARTRRLDARARGRPPRTGAPAVGGGREELPKWLHRGPSGHRVVADVEETARLELRLREVEERLALLRAHPREDAVSHDEVELADVLVNEVGEIALEEADVLERTVAGEPFRRRRCAPR